MRVWLSQVTFSWMVKLLRVLQSSPFPAYLALIHIYSLQMCMYLYQCPWKTTHIFFLNVNAQSQQTLNASDLLKRDFIEIFQYMRFPYMSVDCAVNQMMKLSIIRQISQCQFTIYSSFFNTDVHVDISHIQKICILNSCYIQDLISLVHITI